MIASDTLSYLFDPKKATEKLETLEKGWGGTPTERQARQMAAFRLARAIERGEVPPPVADNGSNAAEADNGVAAAPSPASNESDAP